MAATVRYELEPYLDDLEERIDDAVETDLFAQWTDFVWDRWDDDVFSPKRPASAPPRISWPQVTVNEALDDEDAMILQQLGSCSQMLEQGTGGILCVRCNYGTGILPSLFGARIYRMPPELNTLPTAVPFPDGLDAALALLDRGVPELTAGQGGQVLALGERFQALLAERPLLQRHVHLYHPDLQGPIDVCELLVGCDLFTAVLERPDCMEQVLDLITTTYIRFMRAWHAIAPPMADVAVHWSLLHRGTVMLRDDSAMNLSPDLFETFIRPYDQRVLEAFGGGAMHFCGRGDHYIGQAAEMTGLYAVNLSQPEYNDMETIYRSTIDRDIALLALPRAAVDAADRPLHGRVHTW